MPDTPARSFHLVPPTGRSAEPRGIAHHAGFRRRGSISIWRPALLAVGLAIAVSLIAISDVRAVLGDIHRLVDGLGIWGPIVFLGIFIVWVILALPGSWLSIMAGALWGTLVGFGVAITGATLGAAVCFLIARHFAREPVARLARRSERFCRLDQRTRDYGAIAVVVVRLIPLFPYNITNYAFGLTAVSFWTYIFWSFLCMIPGTLFLVAGSDALARALSEGQAPPELLAIAAVSLAILGILIILARRQLRRREACVGETG